jgi:hypothetical protein
MTAAHNPHAQNPDEMSPQRELARKLNLLLDVVVAEGNTPYTYRQIEAGLKERGLSLSRARWAYMIRGEGPLVTEPALLTGIAEFFRIPPEYMLGSDDDLPERVDAQLAFVKSLRVARVVSFAARTLDGVSPETLQTITDLLKQSTPGPESGTRA